MLTLEQCRKLDPELEGLADEELQHVLDLLYGLGQLAFEDWQKQTQAGSKFPLGVVNSQ